MENIPLLKSVENKDPSLNWNIDVSAELEKYLSAIELLDNDMNYGQNSEMSGYGQNSENVNGGNGNYTQLFNFVEAALIIQNSTSLYSKKIEHLHSLVFDTFHLLSTGKSQISDGKSGGNDDTNPTNQLSNKNCMTEKNTAFLMSNIVSVPIELLQPGKNINLPSEQLGTNNLSDDILTKYSSYSSYIGVSSLGTNISLPQYRIDTSSNTLFLDEADLRYFSSNISLVEQECLDDAFAEDNEHEFQENSQDHKMQNHGGDYGMDLHDKDDSGCAGADLEATQVMEECQSFMEDFENVESSLTNHIDEEEQGVKAVTGGRKGKTVEDYWVFMDEHVKLGKDRPLKPGKTYKVPSKNYTMSLESISQKEDILNFIDVYALTCYFMGMTKIDGEKYNPGTQKLPYFSDLKPPKLNIEKLQTFDDSDDHFMRSLEPDFNESSSSWRKHHSKIFFRTIEKKKGVFSSGVDSYEDGGELPEFNEAEMAQALEFELEPTQDVVSDPELELDPTEVQVQEDERLLEGVHHQENPAADDSSMAGILDFEQDLSELHARINMWTGHVEPLLRAQSSRPEFDIHDEGRKIIDRIRGVVNATEDKPVKFEEITYGLSKWQICRSFLATLMLSNNREIDILQEGQDADNEEMDFFSIKLLDERERSGIVNTGETNIERVSRAKLDFPRKKKTKKDLTANLEEDRIELENMSDEAQKISRKRGSKAT